MNDLKTQLGSLRIDREPKPRSRRWLGYAFILILLPAALGIYLIRGGTLVGALNAAEVETVRPTVRNSGETMAGTPILTASGYIVARRKAVVSAKIQGRLA